MAHMVVPLVILTEMYSERVGGVYTSLNPLGLSLTT